MLAATLETAAQNGAPLIFTPKNFFCFVLLPVGERRGGNGKSLKVWLKGFFFGGNAVSAAEEEGEEEGRGRAHGNSCLVQELPKEKNQYNNRAFSPKKSIESKSGN